MLPAVGSDWGWIMFSPQTNRTRLCLKPDRDHLFHKVLVRLFWSAPECAWCVHTFPNELHQGGKHSRVRFNQTKQGSCENALRFQQKHTLLTFTLIYGSYRCVCVYYTTMCDYINTVFYLNRALASLCSLKSPITALDRMRLRVMSEMTDGSSLIEALQRDNLDLCTCATATEHLHLEQMQFSRNRAHLTFGWNQVIVLQTHKHHLICLLIKALLSEIPSEVWNGQ